MPPRWKKSWAQSSLLSGLTGYALGGALAFMVAAFIQRFVPFVSIAFSWTHFAGAFGAALAMSVLASYIPIRKIDGIDPAIVFKA